jgi:hypothetical protein
MSNAKQTIEAGILRISMTLSTGILIKFYWNLSNIWVKGKLCMKDW